MYASRETASELSSTAASGGRLSWSSSAAAETWRLKRADSRSQKMPPKWFTGRVAVATVSGNSTAHSES
jgi:hypothetical protein